MPYQMLGRPVLRKHTSYSFYRPSAHALGKTLADIPFSASRIIIFNIIVYFLTGLHRSAGAFWTFHLFVYTTFIALQGLFRTFGLVCFSFESAFRLVAVVIPNLYVYPSYIWGANFMFCSIIYMGYMIPVQSMKRWLFWIVSD
jgi:ATP-binding cassette subfamily G (WHITE) protein 2 (SNQ2)